MPLQSIANGSVGVKNGGDIALSPSALFAIVWDALADMLGTAAAAAIVRRAAARASTECPELTGLVILREELEYRYTLPASWSLDAVGRVPIGLHALAAEIGRLLVELTGTVVVCRLEQIPELRDGAFVWREKEAN